MPSVLIIEDDPAIRQSLVSHLASAGFDVDAAATGLAGVEAMTTNEWDAVLLDLGLPDLDGADVLRMIRGLGDTPVMVATAQDDERTIVALFNAGADDYVTKPFSASHIEARLRALLRRSSGSAPADVLVVGDLSVDVGAKEATLAGVRLDLTLKEFELLAYLASKPNVLVSKRELMAEVWRQPYGGADKTVDVHLSWLRRKLGETAAEPRYLHTRRGAGVRLVDPSA
jgi:DNA-binding response OmpR family regulator